MPTGINGLIPVKIHDQLARFYENEWHTVIKTGVYWPFISSIDSYHQSSTNHQMIKIFIRTNKFMWFLLIYSLRNVTIWLYIIITPHAAKIFEQKLYNRIRKRMHAGYLFKAYFNRPYLIYFNKAFRHVEFLYQT